MGDLGSNGLVGRHCVSGQNMQLDVNRESIFRPLQVTYKVHIRKPSKSSTILSSKQCCKFLSPGRPRLPGLGLGYLLPEAGSPGGRPKMTISRLLIGLQNSITTQIAVQMVEQIHLKHNIFTFTNNFLIKGLLY